jgi:ABC-type taurine transport system substrate-binding protein
MAKKKVDLTKVKPVKGVAVLSKGRIDADWVWSSKRAAVWDDSDSVIPVLITPVIPKRRTPTRKAKP